MKQTWHPTRWFNNLTGTPLRRALVLFVFVCLIKLAQAPVAFILPSLFYEDGRDMFAFYLNDHSVSNIFRFYAGYRSIAANVVGFVGAWLDPRATPYFYGLSSLAWCAACYVLLASGRMRHVVPDARSRFLVALVVAAMPLGNFALLSVNDYSKWHQLMLFILLLVSLPPTTRAGEAVEFVVLLLLTWTNPGTIPCILLLIPAALFRRQFRQRVGLALVGISLLAYAKWGIDWRTAPPLPMGTVLSDSVTYFLQRVVFEGILGSSTRIQFLRQSDFVLLHGVAIIGILLCIRLTYHRILACGREGGITVASMSFVIVVLTIVSVRSGRVDWVDWGHHYAYIQQILFVWLLTVGILCKRSGNRLPERPSRAVWPLAGLFALIIFSNIHNRGAFTSRVHQGMKVMDFTRQVSQELNPRTRTLPRDRESNLVLKKDGKWDIVVVVPRLDTSAR